MALEADELAAALKDALKDPELRNSLQGLASTPTDPWRNVRHFLAGMVTFCAAIIVGVFNALPDTISAQHQLLTTMLGDVLAWIAITAVVATACGICAQLGSVEYRTAMDNNQPYQANRAWLIAAMGLPMLTGAVAVFFTAEYGWRLG